MNLWLIAPVAIPLFGAALSLWLERNSPRAQATFSLLAVVASLGAALTLAQQAAGGTTQVLLVGNWPAPFGIVLALDRLAALMLVLTAVLALAALAHALAGEAQRGLHFHALFQFQLMGLNGAFLAGDLFNLFVFFELLLAASYGLVLHGGGTARLRAGFHYVVFNLSASALFLVALSMIYAVAGTLNLADLALRAPRLAPGDAPFMQAALLLLVLVFGVKAALLPLYFWLPATYAAAGASVAALFAVMTKVGVYSTLRLLLAVPGAQDMLAPWLLPLGLATVVLAGFGSLAAASLRGLAAYMVIGSAGTLMAAIGLGSASVGAALYYLVHSTLAAAALFLLAQRVADQRGSVADTLVAGPRPGTATGLTFIMVAMALAGLPPLSGFIAKLALLRDSLSHPAAPWFWGVLLFSGLMSLLALARAGSRIFWKTEEVEHGGAAVPTAQALWLRGAPLLALTAATLGLAVFAAPLQWHAAAAAQQLEQPASYASAILGQPPIPRWVP